MTFPTAGLDSNLRRKCRLIKKANRNTCEELGTFGSWAEEKKRTKGSGKDRGRRGLQPSKRGWRRDGKGRNMSHQAPLVTCALLSRGQVAGGARQGAGAQRLWQGQPPRKGGWADEDRLE